MSALGEAIETGLDRMVEDSKYRLQHPELYRHRWDDDDDKDNYVTISGPIYSSCNGGSMTSLPHGIKATVGLYEPGTQAPHSICVGGMNCGWAPDSSLNYHGFLPYGTKIRVN